MDGKRNRDGREAESRWMGSGIAMDGKRSRDGWEAESRWMGSGIAMDGKRNRDGRERDLPALKHPRRPTRSVQLCFESKRSRPPAELAREVLSTAHTVSVFLNAKAPVKLNRNSGREGARKNSARKNGAEGSRTPVPIQMKSRIYACSRPFNLGLRSVGRRRAADLGTQFSRSSAACQPFGTSPICVGPPPHRASSGVTARPN